MNSYLSELNEIYNIEAHLENKIFKQIENKLYDDSFLSHFKQAFIELNLSNIKQLDYKLIEKTISQKNQIDNELESKITKTQILSELVSDLELENFKQEFEIPKKLKETFDIVFQKTNINPKDKYANASNKLNDHIIDKNIKINQLPTKSESDIIYYDFLSRKITTKFEAETINYILKIIDSVQLNNNLILHIFFAPHIENAHNLYILLCHIFESITILFPLNLSITNNKVIIVCNNKINNIIINPEKLYYIKTNDLTYQNRLIKFETEIFNFIKSSLELFLYMLLIKNDEPKYNVLKYKIIGSIK